MPIVLPVLQSRFFHQRLTCEGTLSTSFMHSALPRRLINQTGKPPPTSSTTLSSTIQNHQRTNRQNFQLGIKCTIRHFKLYIGDWRLDIWKQARIGQNGLEQAGLCWNMLKYAEIGWNKLEQTGICWKRLEQAIIGLNRLNQARLNGKVMDYSDLGLFQPILAYSSLF